MSVAMFAIVNLVLAVVVLAVILTLHVWAILTAHRDHVPAAEAAPVFVVEDQRDEVLPAEAAVAPALA